MDYSQVPMILTLAFGLGLLHSLDADHIMAVTTLSVKRPTIKHSVLFCRNWAIGHGFALLVISSVVLLIGQAIALSVSHIAEQLKRRPAWQLLGTL